MEGDVVLTHAQRRALMALPEDGSWLIPFGSIKPALNALQRCQVGSVECEGGLFGAQGGYCTRYRLTPFGIALRQRLAESDKIADAGPQ